MEGTTALGCEDPPRSCLGELGRSIQRIGSPVAQCTTAEQAVASRRITYPLRRGFETDCGAESGLGVLIE